MREKIKNTSNTMKMKEEGYQRKHKRNDEEFIKRVSLLTLLTYTRGNAEYCVIQTESLLALVTKVGEGKSDTKSTGSNDDGQPQAVPESCDVATPCHVGYAAQKYEHLGAQRQIGGLRPKATF